MFHLVLACKMWFFLVLLLPTQNSGCNLNLNSTLLSTKFKNRGCFTMDSLKYNNDLVGIPTKILDPCLSPCNHTLLGHFAVQQITEDNSRFFKFFCLCGRDIELSLQRVETSECQCCTETECNSTSCDSLCGSKDTVSLYLIHDDDSPMISNENYDHNMFSSTKQRDKNNLSFVSGQLQNDDHYFIAASEEQEIAYNNLFSTTDENSDDAFITNYTSAVKEHTNSFLMPVIGIEDPYNYFRTNSEQENVSTTSKYNNSNVYTTTTQDSSSILIISSFREQNTDDNFSLTTEQENLNNITTKVGQEHTDNNISTTTDQETPSSFITTSFREEDNDVTNTTEQENIHNFITTSFGQEDVRINLSTNPEKDASNNFMTYSFRQEDIDNNFSTPTGKQNSSNVITTVYREEETKNNFSSNTEADTTKKFTTTAVGQEMLEDHFIISSNINQVKANDVIINDTQKIYDYLTNNIKKNDNLETYSDNLTKEDIYIHTTTPSFKKNKYHINKTLKNNQSDSNSDTTQYLIAVCAVVLACLAFGSLLVYYKYHSGEYTLLSVIPN